MPKLKTEQLGTGDQSWLDSTHAMRNARTGTFDVSAFTAATHYPNGFIPSGTPVALVGGLLVPYDKNEATTTDAGVLAGHVLTDKPVVGTTNFSGPLLDHGRVKVSKVPYSGGFAAPVAAAKRSAVTIVFVA